MTRATYLAVWRRWYVVHELSFTSGDAGAVKLGDCSSNWCRKAAVWKRKLPRSSLQVLPYSRCCFWRNYVWVNGYPEQQCRKLVDIRHRKSLPVLSTPADNTVAQIAGYLRQRQLRRTTSNAL